MPPGAVAAPTLGAILDRALDMVLGLVLARALPHWIGYEIVNIFSAQTPRTLTKYQEPLCWYEENGLPINKMQNGNYEESTCEHQTRT